MTTTTTTTAVAAAMLAIMTRFTLNIQLRVNDSDWIRRKPITQNTSSFGVDCCLIRAQYVYVCLFELKLVTVQWHYQNKKRERQKNRVLLRWIKCEIEFMFSVIYTEQGEWQHFLFEHSIDSNKKFVLFNTFIVWCVVSCSANKCCHNPKSIGLMWN